jgi:hypothetical protein
MHWKVEDLHPRNCELKFSALCSRVLVTCSHEHLRWSIESLVGILIKFRLPLSALGIFC